MWAKNEPSLHIIIVSYLLELVERMCWRQCWRPTLKGGRRLLESCWRRRAKLLRRMRDRRDRKWAWRRKREACPRSTETNAPELSSGRLETTTHCKPNGRGKGRKVSLSGIGGKEFGNFRVYPVWVFCLKISARATLSSKHTRA